MKLKKILMCLLAGLFLFATPVFAEGEGGGGSHTFTPSDKGAEGTFKEGMEEVSGTVSGVLKVVIDIIRQGAAILAFAFAVGGYFIGANYVKKKQEQNQGNEAPQLVRIGIPVASGLAGLFVVFVIIGLFGKIFLGLDFSESWDWAVTSVLGGLGAPTTKSGQ